MFFCFGQTVTALQYGPEEHYQRKFYFFSVSVCACVHVSVRSHVWSPEAGVWCSPLSLATCVLRQRLSLNLQLADSVMPAGQQASGSLLSPQLWEGACHCAQIFTRF